METEKTYVVLGATLPRTIEESHTDKGKSVTTKVLANLYLKETDSNNVIIHEVKKGKTLLPRLLEYPSYILATKAPLKNEKDIEEVLTKTSDYWIVQIDSKVLKDRQRYTVNAKQLDLAKAKKEDTIKNIINSYKNYKLTQENKEAFIEAVKEMETEEWMNTEEALETIYIPKKTIILENTEIPKKTEQNFSNKKTKTQLAPENDLRERDKSKQTQNSTNYMSHSYTTRHFGNDLISQNTQIDYTGWLDDQSMENMGSSQPNLDDSHHVSVQITNKNF